MFKRDFTNESILNSIDRLHRAVFIRLRGLKYYIFCSFYNRSGYSCKFGKNIKFINTKSIQLASNVSFGDNCRLECFNSNNNVVNIKIGSNTSFGDNLHIGSISYVEIGQNVLGASKILIIDHNHGNVKNLLQEAEIPPNKRSLVSSKGPIIIGDNVWLGEGAIILSGAMIGNGAIIPAYSIVKGQVDSNSIYNNKK